MATKPLAKDGTHPEFLLTPVEPLEPSPVSLQSPHPAAMADSSKCLRPYSILCDMGKATTQ